MSDTGPNLRSLGLWAQRQSRCLEILERATLLLRGEAGLPETEIDLNRHLYFCLLAASRELYPQDPVAPISECNNQPDPDDVARAAREAKRPDFQWIYLDRYEPNPNHSSKQFVVECKRLGRSVSASWILNLNYVGHGVWRFRDAQWAYGRRFPSGAMVGYCQTMDRAEVLNEVNEEVRRSSLPDLVLRGVPANPCNHLDHTFERSFEVSPFRLHHLWIDLRPESTNESELAHETSSG
jgi:hypothetical protein